MYGVLQRHVSWYCTVSFLAKNWKHVLQSTMLNVVQMVAIPHVKMKSRGRSNFKVSRFKHKYVISSRIAKGTCILPWR